MSELRDALLRVGVAEVDESARRRSEYAADASLYRIRPQAVAYPRHGDEVIAALDVCRRLGVPVTGRGGGTSIAGNAIGPGLVLDYSRHLNRLVDFDPEARTAVVQPGLVLDAAQARTVPHGLRFGPDPSTHNRATFGGLIGNNSCGSHALAYGRTADNVLAADVVFGNGERATLGVDDASLSTSSTVWRLATMVDRNLATVRTELGRFSRQGSGYALEHLLPERRAPVRAFVGTEGTWGQVLSATVRLVPAPAATAVAVLGYADMAAAADAAPALVPMHAQAIEGLDRRIVDVVRRTRGPAAVPPLPRGDGWLLVETAGSTTAEAAAAAARVAASGQPLDHLVLTDLREMASVWRIREDGAGLVARPSGGRGAQAGFEDAAVPVERLGAYLRDFGALLDQFGLHGVPYGHFGDGCVHVRIDFTLSTEGGRHRFAAFLHDAAELAVGFGGSLSGEHGDGRARSALLPVMYSPAVLALFADAKTVTDPDGLLNPGVLVEPADPAADIRLGASARVHAGSGGLSFPDDAGRFELAVNRCTGVGKCRADTTGAGGVMCPSYLATRDEKDSTRGRARVLQDMVAGELPGGWRSPAVAESLDLCLACKGCTAECPTGVDMAAYKAEVLYQRFRRRLRPRTHYTLGRLPSMLRLIGGRGRLTTLVNAVLRTPMRRLAGAVGGMDASRRLPPIAARTFTGTDSARSLAAAARPAAVTAQPAGAGAGVVGGVGGGVREEGRPERRVALWVDTMTEYLRPSVGTAALRVLQAAGFSVEVIGGRSQRACCGLTLFSTGQLDRTRAELARTAQVLQPYVAAGIPVVGLEPSCVAMLRGDAEALIGRRLNVSTLAEFLTEHAPEWPPPSLAGAVVVAQPHCHHRAVMGYRTDRALLERAGASVTEIGGCCGLAGDFGMTAGKAEVSRKVAATALLPALDARPAEALLQADGYSCHVQIADLRGEHAQHLAELLADRL